MVLQRFPALLVAMCAMVAASVQSPNPPPVKMGLWETTATSQMSGIQLPPDVIAKFKAMGKPVPGGVHIEVTQSCLTPEQWQKDMGLGKSDEGDCKSERNVSAAGKYSFDLTCKSDHGYSTVGHWELQPLDTRHMRGSGQVDLIRSNGQHITMSMTLTSHYLGANCGDVKPGEGKTIRHN